MVNQLLVFVGICFHCLLFSHSSLVNTGFIPKMLTKDAPWSDSHMANGSYLGCGMLYFAIPYALKARVCVCLGSGGAFVPRLMKQAQRESGVVDGRTILVDGNMGNWGRPHWLSRSSFFRSDYPDVEIIIDTTSAVSKRWDRNVKIDYLHIDADHSAEGSMRDFLDYLPLMAPNGIITFHDTNGGLPCSQTADAIRKKGYEIVDFKEFGAGVALISPKKK